MGQKLSSNFWTSPSALAGADTGAGRRGPWPRPLVKVAPLNRVKVPQVGHILRRKCPSWVKFCREVPQLGHILKTKCLGWGKFYVKSPPRVANFPKNVPHVAKFIRAFFPTLSFGPSPIEILYPPLPCHQKLTKGLNINFLGGGGKIEDEFIFSARRPFESYFMFSRINGRHLSNQFFICLTSFIELLRFQRG